MNIKELKTELENTKREVENLNSRIKEIEKQISESRNNFGRANKGETYYVISYGKCFDVYKSTEDYTDIDTIRFQNNNYFLTKERAQEVVDKINFLLRLERFKDELCPDYIPNWNNANELKYNIYFDYDINEYCIDTNGCWGKKNEVYFPTREVAEQVCNTLNEELKHNNNQ